MITDWILSAITTALSALLDLIPPVTLPSVFASIGSAGTTVGGWIAPMTFWLPVALFATYLLSLAVAYGIGLVMRATRKIIDVVRGSGA